MATAVQFSLRHTCGWKVGCVSAGMALSVGTALSVGSVIDCVIGLSYSQKSNC